MKGIDVSVHNGNIDWNRVKNAGIQFAILRAGYGKVASQKDRKFEENYNGAKAAGVPVGAYWYSYAKTVAEARQEAEVCVSILAGKQFEYPIWFDQEERDILATGKANCSAMMRAFCEVLEQAGYWVGLYTSRSFLASNIEDDIKSRYALWIAEWGSKLNYSGSVGIWQYSDKGHVDGISGAVDLDECYVGANGFEPIVEPELFATVQNLKGKPWMECQNQRCIVGRTAGESMERKPLPTSTTYIPDKAVFEREKTLKKLLNEENADAGAIKTAIMDLASAKYDSIM